MNKKGVELPTNALIIILLAVVAGGIVLVFFLGGAGPLTQTLQEWWRGTTAGTDRNMAVELCNKYCLDAKGYSSDVQVGSAFCKKYWNIDANHDGEADFDPTIKEEKIYDRYYCSSGIESKVIAGIKNAKSRGQSYFKGKVKNLGVGCAGVTC